jgi:hypothetical protein
MPNPSLTIDDLDQLERMGLHEPIDGDHNRSSATDDKALRRLMPEVEETFTNLRRRATSWACGIAC